MQGLLGWMKDFTLGEGGVLVAALSVESSCPGSAPQAGGVDTCPCAFGQGSREAVGDAAGLPSDVGGVFGQQSVLDLGMAGQGKGLHHGETSCEAEEHHPVASQGAQHEGHT